MKILRLVYSISTVLSVYPNHEKVSNEQEVNKLLNNSTNYNQCLKECAEPGYEINLANDLDLDIYKMLFYNIKHNRPNPLSIPIELKQNHHKILTMVVISGDTLYIVEPQSN